MRGCYGLPSYEEDYRITIKTNGDLLAVVKKKTNYRIMRIKEKDRLWRKGVFFSLLRLYFQKYEQYHSDICKRSNRLSVSCPFLQELCNLHKLLQAPR